MCAANPDTIVSWQGSIIMVIEASNLTAACSWVLGGFSFMVKRA
jgi:hypothetical protein